MPIYSSFCWPVLRFAKDHCEALSPVTPRIRAMRGEFGGATRIITNGVFPIHGLVGKNRRPICPLVGDKVAPQLNI